MFLPVWLCTLDYRGGGKDNKYHLFLKVLINSIDITFCNYLAD